MKHSIIDQSLFNAPTIFVLVVGFLGALFSSRMFMVRLLNLPQTACYRVSAILPSVMGLIFCWLPAVAMSGYWVNFAGAVCLAFGFVFALDNIRAPSRHSRVLGALFLLLYGWLLYMLVSHELNSGGPDVAG